jgi:hypothetical protein
VKTCALVGFTRADAFCWLATEARAEGKAVLMSACQKNAWVGVDHYLLVRDEAELEVRIVPVDQIITRQSMEDAA